MVEDSGANDLIEAHAPCAHVFNSELVRLEILSVLLL